jgi:phosphate transport system permease protein
VPTLQPHPLGRFAPEPGMRRRRWFDRGFRVGATLAAILAVGLLSLVIVSVLLKGAPALSWRFLTHTPRISPFGINTGGIANAIAGSSVLIGLASLMAVPAGILVGIFVTQFSGRRLAASVSFALDVLNGVPTIVTGVFVFGVLVIGGRQSGWAGAVALAIVELPIVGRGAEQVLALVPDRLAEAGLALGLPRWRIIVSIILPTALGGLLSGAILAVARVAGETAPLIFCSSFARPGLSLNPAGPLANLPVTIFNLSQSPSPASHAQAWAAALVLIVGVLILSLLARLLLDRSVAALRR